MTLRRFAATFALAAVALIMLLAAVVFLGAPRHAVGWSQPRFHASDLAYLGIPLLLFGAAGAVPLSLLLRSRRRQQR